MLEPAFPRVITSSLRETFNKCHKKFHWDEILGIRPRGASTDLIAGGAFAAAVEAYRRVYYGSASAGYDAAVAAGLLALIKSYGVHIPPDNHPKDYDGVVSAYIEYLVRYPPRTEYAKPSIGPLGPRVEFSFTFEVPNCFHPVSNDPILFAGRFDQLAEYNGAYFVFDDKTTKSLGESWRGQWDLRTQFTGYAVGADAMGFPAIGAIVRGLSILKTKCDTQEAIVYRPPHIKERWKERLVWDVQRMIHHWKINYWPHTGEESGACSDYGGCAYKTLCQAERPEAFIPVYYDEGRWDPIAREIV